MAKKKAVNADGTSSAASARQKPPLPACGLVMPISDHGGLSSSHWREVEHIIRDAVSKVVQEVRLVSESDGSDMIHKRIVERLYTDEIVIADISTLNPNVMFELGLRLAFDRPTVIVADDGTPPPFDVSLKRYVSYPRSLRHGLVEAFKDDLKDSVLATIKGHKEEPDKYSFLKAVGPIISPGLREESVDTTTYFKSRLDDIEASIRRLASNSSGEPLPKSPQATSSTQKLLFSRDSIALVETFLGKEIGLEWAFKYSTYRKRGTSEVLEVEWYERFLASGLRLASGRPIPLPEFHRILEKLALER